MTATGRNRHDMARSYVERGIPPRHDRPAGSCNTVNCPEPAAYLIRFDGCGPCTVQNHPDCHGRHELCIRHTAHVRQTPPPWLGPANEIRTLHPTD